ncbi:two-component system activity regulator YycH [Effusibacillus dendaii]|uniref:Regulatory protein YycH domain-containing protein n=1 Tax=Effusibacillus dendaii TaxID=2743772 RepID=A0A7I8DBH9_9BACL|nr:two-component system activity regulator YycH [Effusibacillus dendaii]BCJ87528.1 hypothetical protein skT53_25130 [Effusibacillus dendaii]
MNQMGERIKDAALVLLVALSLVLTFGLWNTAPPAEWVDAGGFVPNPAFGFTKSVEELLRPDQVEVRLPDQSLTLLTPFSVPYEKAWEALRKTTAGEWEPVQEAAAFQQKVDMLPHIHFHFGLALTGEQLSKIVKMPDRTSTHVQVRSIVMFQDTDGFHLWLTDGGTTAWQATIGGQSPLFEQMAQWEALPKYEKEAGSSGPIFVPKENLQVPLVTYEVMNLPSDWLARSFFVDPTLPRRIQERDGSVLVTDGNRTVQIGADGQEIRYTFSLPMEAESPDSLPDVKLQRAVSFVNDHGGLQNAFLVQSEEFPEGNRIYRFRSYRNGLPIESELTTVDVALSGNEVVEMKRNTVYLGAQLQSEMAEVKPPPVKDWKQVGKMELVYGAILANGELRLRPVWKISHVDHSLAVFDAITGATWPGREE